MTPLKLLSIEWKKFGSLRTFWILCALYVVLYALVGSVALNINLHLSFAVAGNSYNPTGELFRLPRIWELVAYLGSWMNAMLLGLLGILLVTSEIGHRTLRQTIISGLSRREAFLGKVLFAVALAFAATGVFLVLGVYLGFRSSPDPFWVDVLPPASLTVRYFIQALCYTVVGLMVGLICKNGLLGALLHLPYVLFAESAAYWLLFFLSGGNFPEFLPNQVFRDLVPLPLPQMAERALHSNNLMLARDPNIVSLLALGYLSVFTVLLFLLFRKRDL